MSIRRRILWVLVGSIVSYSVAQYAIERTVILPRFVSLQREHALQQVQGCVASIKHQIDALSNLTKDWSAWDDTYQFIQDTNPRYIQSNLAEEGLVRVRLNLVVFCNLSGQIVWSKAYSQGDWAETSLAGLMGPGLDPVSRMLQHGSEDSSVNGIALTEQGLMMLSSEPVVQSNGNGPIQGTLIMGRFLDPNLVSQLASDVGIDFKILAVPEAQSGRPGLVDRIASGGEVVADDPSHGVLWGHAVMQGLDGQPALVVEARIPASIMAQGWTVIRFASLSVLLIGVIVLLVVYWTLDSLLLRRLGVLSSTLQLITKSGDLAVLIPVRGHDELGVVEENIRQMLRQIHQANGALQESEIKYRRVFDSVLDGVYMVDIDGKITSANTHLCRLLGYSQEDLVGQQALKVIHPADYHVFEEFLTAVSGQGAFRGIIRHIRRGGQALTTEVRGAVICAEGRVFAMAVVRDMTGRPSPTFAQVGCADTDT